MHRQRRPTAGVQDHQVSEANASVDGDDDFGVFIGGAVLEDEFRLLELEMGRGRRCGLFGRRCRKQGDEAADKNELEHLNSG